MLNWSPTGSARMKYPETETVYSEQLRMRPLGTTIFTYLCVPWQWTISLSMSRFTTNRLIWVHLILLTYYVTSWQLGTAQVNLQSTRYLTYFHRTVNVHIAHSEPLPYSPAYSQATEPSIRLAFYNDLLDGPGNYKAIIPLNGWRRR